MERYVAARPDVFFTGATDRCGRTGCCASSPASTRSTCSSARRCRSTRDANSSTVTEGRLSGFRRSAQHGPRPARPPARLPRVAEPAARRGAGAARTQARRADRRRRSTPAALPTFVESLDAVEVGKDAGMPIPPVMIYGDDVSHVVTEEGVAYLYKAPVLADRRAALAAIAGVTPVGRGADAAARRSGCAATAWSPSRRTSGSTSAWPTGRCWRPAASTTSSPGPAACTTRPPSSGTGERHDGRSDAVHATLARTPLLVRRVARRLAVGALRDEAR